MISWPTPDISFVRWAAELRLSRPDIEINPKIIQESGWKNWANQVNQSRVCQTFNTPRAEAFPTWRRWAEAFIRAFGPQA